MASAPRITEKQLEVLRSAKAGLLFAPQPSGTFNSARQGIINRMHRAGYLDGGQLTIEGARILEDQSR